MTVAREPQSVVPDLIRFVCSVGGCVSIVVAIGVVYMVTLSTIVSDHYEEDVGEFRSGLKHGYWIEWDYYDGPIGGGSVNPEEGHYVDGLREGKWVKWWTDLSGNRDGMLWEREYQGGKANGMSTEFDFESGRKTGEGVLKDGEKHGRWVSWHEKGARSAEGGYVEGWLVGLWTYWHPNGTRSAQGTYVEGVASGEWTYWLENGQVDLDRSGTYVGGTLVGKK